MTSQTITRHGWIACDGVKLRLRSRPSRYGGEVLFETFASDEVVAVFDRLEPGQSGDPSMRPGSVEVDGEHVRWLLADGRELWPHPEGTTKIVFLDFDGVLNHEEWYAQRPAKPARLEVMDERVARWCFDPKAAGRLNVLVDAGAKFVISSTWRLHSDLDELRRILVALGFRGEVIGVTPDLSNKSRSIHAAHVRRRGAEIQAWMDEHGTPSSFVILDDDDDMEHLIDRLVQTDFETGLQDEHITRALEKLAETYEPERGAHGR